MSDNLPARLESIVFDFDGTLAELKIDFYEMKHRIGRLAQSYLDSPPPPLKLPALEWLETLVASVRKDSPENAGEFERSAQSLIVDIELEAARRGALFPFTRQILRRLQDRMVKVAIITRNCEDAVRIVFPDMEDYCSCFLARNHVPRVKPHPDHLLRALQEVKAAPESSLMVGDHPLDIQTGVRAGTLTAGVWSGNASREDLIESGANWTARNCEELIAALGSEGFV
jgi:phosphoglycolate phosphatase